MSVTTMWRAPTWRQIAAEIKETTGVAVSHESLRGWFADRESSGAA